MGSARKHLLNIVLLCVAFGLWGCSNPGAKRYRVVQETPWDAGGTLVSLSKGPGEEIDYQQVRDASGRTIELRYRITSGETWRIIALDAVDPCACPHLIIAVDGAPHGLVKQLCREEGLFRLFHRPSRLVSCFPAMTDLAYQRLFGGATPLGFEAQYFNRDRGRFYAGNDVYLSGANADWANRLTYRCSFNLDSLAYLWPSMVFDTELREMAQAFDDVESGTAIGYTVATAGLSTRGGEEAIKKYLRRIDAFCEEIVHEREGRVNLTLLADHGHNLTTGGGRVSFSGPLRKAGFHVGKRLEKPEDVVPIKYGLVTYAAFYANDPQGVADVLLEHPQVTLAAYPDQGGVAVRRGDERALIIERGGDFKYEMQSGDPLRLGETVDELRLAGEVDGDGFIDDRALFDATAGRQWPDAVRRLWLAFNGLVQYPADVLVCIEDGYWYGDAFFEAAIGGPDSTHGSLNRVNSNTFVMSMLGALPATLRLEEVMPALNELRQTTP